jgi:hypothetical protein
MRAMFAPKVMGFGALGLVVAGCAKAPAHSTLARSVDTEPATETASAAPGLPPSEARDAPTGSELVPVPEAVTRLHRNAFREAAGDSKLDRVVCFVTLHEASLKRGEIFPLVLFADGSVATWRQKATGSEEPFFAKLSREEQAQATQLIAAIPRATGTASETFAASSLVMGVSVRVNEQVQTLYFDHHRMPSALAQLVGLLKQRLEATNRAP